MIRAMNIALSFVAHITGIVLWMTGLFSMSRTLMMAAKIPAAERPRLAVLAGRQHIFAAIGAVLTIAAGLYQLSLWPDGGFRHARWFHHKLTLVLVLVGCHVALFLKHRRWSKQAAEAPLSGALPGALHGVIGLVLIGILLSVYLGTPHFLRSMGAAATALQ